MMQSIGMESRRTQNKHLVRMLLYTIMTLLNVVLTFALLSPICGNRHSYLQHCH